VSADEELAGELATAAGELLVRLREATGFDDVPALRAVGDRRSHEFLVGRLAVARPADVVLSEEGRDDPARLVADRVWIVDPLDGTNEFGDEGRTDWAVHVALWERGAAGLTAGAVALPARGVTLSTGAALPPLPPGGDPPRIAVSRSRAPAFVGEVAAEIGAVTVAIGSAGMKAMAILLGEADAYVHRGRMKEWDSAAPAAVAAAAGLHVSRLDGSPLSFNRPDRLTPDLLICRPTLAEPLLDALAAVAGSES
jgi:3'(2'), 5'-bisphosphate nucleotidase